MPEPEGELGEPDLPDLPDLENEQGNLLGGVDNKTIKPFNLFTLEIKPCGLGSRFEVSVHQKLASSEVGG